MTQNSAVECSPNDNKKIIYNQNLYEGIREQIKIQ